MKTLASAVPETWRKIHSVSKVSSFDSGSTVIAVKAANTQFRLDTHIECHISIDSNCQQCSEDDEQENEELQQQNTVYNKYRKR